MKFTETPLKGVYLINLEQRGDNRGWFARFFCPHEFEQHGLCADIAQMNNSLNKYKGTLRGLHYQLAPKAENKIIRCIRGAFFDIVVDLRPDSPTFLKNFSVELSAENRTTLYVPAGCATGLLTLADDTESIYLTTEFYSPEHERGLRYNDPKLGLRWPSEPVVISDKDLKHPDFDPAIHLPKQGWVK
jgi:dTDP-4-dehydrorhamnose 3,5-epimerase